jgi:uncharacterized protein with PIN domain
MTTLDNRLARARLRLALLAMFRRHAPQRVSRAMIAKAAATVKRLEAEKETAMTCPCCHVGLEYRTQEEVTEQAHSGDYPTHSVTSWHSYKCPSCKRATEPRGAELFARMDVRGWRDG